VLDIFINYGIVNTFWCF